MSYKRSEIMNLDPEEKRKLAFELLDSIDEEFVQKEIPVWKKNLVKERIALDKQQPNNVISWNELKKKYSA